MLKKIEFQRGGETGDACSASYSTKLHLFMTF